MIDFEQFKQTHRTVENKFTGLKILMILKSKVLSHTLLLEYLVHKSGEMNQCIAKNN